MPIQQIAYFVADIRVAARRHRDLFGSGPFFVVDHVPTPVARYRGRDTTLDHGSAYGQWGAVMVEFVQQHDDAPSAFHDMYPCGSGREGLHHVALFVDDLTAAMAAHERAGRTVATYAETAGGVAFAMVDTVRDYGHMIELYEPSPMLRDFYDRMAGIANPVGPAFIDL